MVATSRQMLDWELTNQQAFYGTVIKGITSQNELG